MSISEEMSNSEGMSNSEAKIINVENNLIPLCIPLQNECVWESTYFIQQKISYVWFQSLLPTV